MTSHSVTAANPLFDLQQTLYNSSNFTRRRLHRARLQWVTNAIAAHAPQVPLPRAIEFGPGSGIYLPVLARHFPDVVAADVQPAYLDGIRPLLSSVPGLSLVTDDLLDSKIPANSFGLLLCSEVLEHVTDPERAITALYNILAPESIAIITTPQRFSLMELCSHIAFLPGIIHLVRLIYREPILETGHIGLRTATAIRRRLQETGFTILTQDKFALYVPLLAEFGGEPGGRLIASLEKKIKGTWLDWTLWTQAYVVRKPAA